MMIVPSRVVALCLLLAVTSVPMAASAQTPVDDDAYATEMKNQGNAEMGALNYVGALEKFDEGLKRAKDATLRASLFYNKGRTFQAIGNYPAALDALETFDKSAPPELRAKVSGFEALLEDLRGRVATLSLSCNVAGAEIFVDNKRTDNCRGDVTELRLRAGRARLEVRKDGYAPFATDLDLLARQPNALKVVLVPRVSQGVLRIESVDGARVRLDGKELGRVPWEGPVSAGDHMVELSKEGLETARKPVLVSEGLRQVIKVDSLASPPLTKSATFWGLVGGGVALVAAAVVGIVVGANTEKTPGTGTLAPGRIYTGAFHF